MVKHASDYELERRVREHKKDKDLLTFTESVTKMNEARLLEWLHEQEENAQENAIKANKDKDLLTTNYYDGMADAFYDMINKIWERPTINFNRSKLK